MVALENPYHFRTRSNLLFLIALLVSSNFGSAISSSSSPTLSHSTTTTTTTTTTSCESTNEQNPISIPNGGASEKVLTSKNDTSLPSNYTANNVNGGGFVVASGGFFGGGSGSSHHHLQQQQQQQQQHVASSASISISGEGHHERREEEEEEMGVIELSKEDLTLVVEAALNEKQVKRGGPLKVLFLSADTGGGHRASAESLAKHFQMHYPGTTYDLLDVWTDDGCLPYRTLVSAYKHLSAHPNQWRLFYHLSNNIFYEIMYDTHSRLTCEKKIRKRIASYNPDVVVSVHPTMNNVPLIATKKIGKKAGREIPFFTVVTDFGSAHTTWFQGGVNKMYVASERIRTLAKRRSRITDDKLVMSGLPIRHDFAVEAKKLGKRTSDEGKSYQRLVKGEVLGLEEGKKMILVMGGGEGVGSLGDIVEAMFLEFTRKDIDCTICVVCGRNEKLKQQIASRDWKQFYNDHCKKVQALKPKRSISRLMPAFLTPRRNTINAASTTVHQIPTNKKTGNVNVVGLGFVSNMAEYMVGADVLVTKAGPGTIAEAAALGLPVMLTSFLPGQEAGNVDVVLDGNFGKYCSNPKGIADEVSSWLCDEAKMEEMSLNALKVGLPSAASDIVIDIGDITHQCLKRYREGKD